jgi:hypothetical protein
MLVSITRLHLRSWRFLPSFFVHTLRSTRQVQRAAGFLGGQLAAESWLGFWTITVWADEQAMRRFRNTAEHLKAMSHLLNWCDAASYDHWEQPDASQPALTAAFERLQNTGKLSKVRHPNAAHASGKTTGHAVPKPGQSLRPRAA